MNYSLDFYTDLGLALEEDQYPSKCDICSKPLTVDEGYAVDNQTWCNLCAEQKEINHSYPHDSSDLCWGPDCQDQPLEEEAQAFEEDQAFEEEDQALDEDRYPSKCDICFKPLTDHEGYSDDYETWCNLCAEQEEINYSYCENCEMRFNDDTIIRSTNYDGICETCNDLLDLPANTQSRCDDTSPPNFITCCNCGTEECSDYSYNYKSSVYCNKCAVEVCGEKPKFAFNVVVEKKTFKCARCTDNHDWYERNMVDGNLFCGPCYWYLEMSPKYTLLSRYSTFEKAKLARYAEKHNITLEEALDCGESAGTCANTTDTLVYTVE